MLSDRMENIKASLAMYFAMIDRRVDDEEETDPSKVVYCVVTDPAPSQRHDKIGMMTAQHRDEPCRYRDGGRPRWISNGHVS